MWPFKKKNKEKKEDITSKTVVLTANDSGMRRAEIAMRHAGFAINDTMYDRLAWIAQVFDEYQKLDYNAGKKSKISN